MESLRDINDDYTLSSIFKFENNATLLCPWQGKKKRRLSLDVIYNRIKVMSQFNHNKN